MATSDEDEESEVEGLMEETQTTTPLARPRPRPAYRAAVPVGDQDPAMETYEDDRNEAVGSVPPNSTLQGPPKPKATYQSAKSPSTSPSKMSQPGINGTSTLDTPRKRAREDDEEDQSATDDATTPTQPSDIQIRRKRIRH